jgi:repressor LexA
MQPRTKRQKEVLEYITRHIEQHGYEPSYQQIAWQLGVSSKAGIAKHIASLEKQGLISRRRENGAFGLDVRPNKSVVDVTHEIEWLEIPIEKKSVEDWEGEPLFVPYFMLGYTSPEKISAFRVPNDAMLDEYICEGDIALIEKKQFARDGDCVVAIVDNKDVVLKKYYRVGAEIELRPANDKFKIITIAADQIEILGIFRGLLRPLG